MIDIADRFTALKAEETKADISPRRTHASIRQDARVDGADEHGRILILGPLVLRSCPLTMSSPPRRSSHVLRGKESHRSSALVWLNEARKNLKKPRYALNLPACPAP